MGDNLKVFEHDGDLFTPFPRALPLGVLRLTSMLSPLALLSEVRSVMVIYQTLGSASLPTFTTVWPTARVDCTSCGDMRRAYALFHLRPSAPGYRGFRSEGSVVKVFPILHPMFPHAQCIA